MAWRAAIGRNWQKLRDGAKREFLREPDRVLLERSPEDLPVRAEKEKRAAFEAR
ncbi:MAG TPA: hypothetical protein VJ762_15965 [Sphingobium sp.]|nr:hypothetical protein [Sphingobium sp.]